jgi:two-component system, LytTR family, response regulator
MKNSLRLLIVDDEPLIRLGIRNDLSGMKSVQIAGECGCVAEAVDAIRSDQVDLVLLDVQLPDGTGFDVVRKIGPQRMPAVIFVTAHNKYAIQAFEVNAVDYLLKPFDESRLRESIERARERLLRPPTLIRQLEGLIEAHETQWLQRVVVRNGERFDFVPIDSIDWIESANNYTVLHCRSVDHLFGVNLTTLEHRLDPSRFLRVHRCHMVNIARIVAVHAIAGGVFELELQGGTRVRTGRQYGEKIRKLIKAVS